MGDICGSNGRRVQVKAQRKNGWTKARRATFLAVLAASCNTTTAARAVGKAESSARSLRKRDGEFSQLWEEALEAGYERLENELLARALGQTSSSDNPNIDDIIDAAPVAIDFDPALAIKVLQLRGDQGRNLGQRTGGVRAPAMTQGKIDAVLLQRLDALAMTRAKREDA